MKTEGKVIVKLALVFVGCLTAVAAFSQVRLTDNTKLETLAARALETFLKSSYKGNGRSISASGVNSYLSKHKISLSSLPKDIAADISKGNVEALLIPDVTNPAVPGTTGEVVLVRSKCLLSTRGCSRRGLLIQPPGFFGERAEEEDCFCTICRGCQGPKNPPECDIYDTCVCTRHPCSSGCAEDCPSCPGC